MTSKRMTKSPDRYATRPRANREDPVKCDGNVDPSERHSVSPLAAARIAKTLDHVASATRGHSAAKSQTHAATISSRETKKSRAIALLRTETGITISELSTALGWQQHTTRATLSGMRKAGFAIVVERPAGGSARIYRIVDAAEPTLPARAEQ